MRVIHHHVELGQLILFAAYLKDPIEETTEVFFLVVLHGVIIVAKENQRYLQFWCFWDSCVEEGLPNQV